jgi:hypothetical protein
MNTSNGSPYDRGKADAYYKRTYKQPNKYVDMREVTDLTEMEKAEYMAGFNDETGEKDYGRD